MNYLSNLTRRTAVRDLILWVGAITIITLFVVGVSFYLYTTFSMVNSLRKQANLTAEEIASVLTFPLYSLDDQAAVNSARVYLTSGRLCGIRLVSRASGVLVDSRMNRKSMIPPIEREIRYQGMPLGVMTLIMDDSEIRSTQKNTLIILLLLICGVFVVFALLLHSVFNKVLSVNLNQIIQGINSFGDNNFDEKIKRIKYEDLDQLVLGLNTMAEKIHKNQVEIIESEYRLSIALKGAKSGIWDWNIQTGKIFFDPNYYILAGYEPNEFPHNYEEWEKRVHPDDRKTVKEKIASCVNGKTSEFRVEFRFKNKNNEWMWILSSGKIFEYNGTIPIRFTGIHIDITDRKLAEQELLHLQNYLSNIINSMPSTLIGVDTGGRVTQWNSGAEKVTGFSPKEAAGQLLDKVFPRLAKEMERIREAMKTRQVRRDKNRLLQTESSVSFEDVTIYPLVTNGVDGAVIRIDDVTEQVRLEEMMVQSEKMLSVGGLAAGMAHEINNPLAGIMQTANVMKNRLEDMEIPANRIAAKEIGIPMESIHAYMEKRGILRMIGVINESGRRVAQIVENMLSFSRKTDTSASSHDLVQLMDKTIEIAATDYDLKKRYDFKAITIVKEYESHLPMVPCEGSKIQQVLLNILRNGAQAMQEMPVRNGSSESPCFILRLSCETETDMLKIEIADNGPGMDEAVRKRVFEPFFTTKPPGIGTGLGLSVSYFIITENHNGTMDVLSSPGKGTTFIIRLPLKPERKKYSPQL